MIKVRSMKKQLKYIFLFLIFICLLTGCFSQALYKKISARIVLDYGDTTIVESRATGEFKPEPNASIGSAADGPLEIWYER
ncbi:MAG: hypothetical protein WBJ30_06150, partial [Tepidanaerobacteraceae bacterium]